MKISIIVDIVDAQTLSDILLTAADMVRDDDLKADDVTETIADLINLRRQIASEIDKFNMAKEICNVR